jgi:hypothetical protein
MHLSIVTGFIDGFDTQVRAPLEVVLENTRNLCDLTRRERTKGVVDCDAGSVQGNIFCLQGHLVAPLSNDSPSDMGSEIRTTIP